MNKVIPLIDGVALHIEFGRKEANSLGAFLVKTDLGIGHCYAITIFLIYFRLHFGIAVRKSVQEKI